MFVSGYNKVPQSTLLLLHVPLTQKLLRELILHLPIHVVHKHVRLAAAPPPVPRHHPRRVYGRHPPRRLLVVPRRSIHHYQVPFRLINLAGQTLERQLANRIPGVGNRDAFGRFSDLHQVVCLIHLAIVGDVVRFQHWESPPDLLDPRLVLFEEDRAAAVVQGVPHEAVVAEAEYEEIAGGFFVQDS